MNKKSILLLLFIAAKFMFQYLLIDSSYDLHRDEYLHLDQARHLAWGYDSVPPVTSWISAIVLLLGNSVFWVKFFPALFGAITIVMVWKIIELLGGNIFASVLGAMAVLVSAILRINILFQPNSLEILCWTAFYYALIKYIILNNSKWLYLAFLIFAFGFLNKYNFVFVLLGLLPAALLTEQRKIFLNRHFYFSILLALLLISPNLLWQVQNDYPVFRHLRELNETQLVNVKRADFLKEQLLFFISSVFILLAAFISFFTYAPFKKFRLFFWGYFFTTGLYVYLKAKGYYAIGLYPALLAFGSVYIERLLRAGWKIYLRPFAILSIVLLCIPFIRIGFPSASPAVLQDKLPRYKAFGLLRWEDGKDHNLPQDFADMLGWKELAKKVDSVYKDIDDKAHTLVYCDNYGEAGAVNYYSEFKKINAVSMNADYINWFPPASKEIKNIVLVKDPFDKDTGRLRERPLFEQVARKGKIDNVYAREYGVCIYLLYNAKVPVAAILQKEIAEKKRRR